MASAVQALQPSRRLQPENDRVVWPEEPDDIFGQAGRSHLYPASVELFHQGQLAQDVYFIEGGLVKLNRVTEDGQELILDIRGAGSCLAVAALVLERPHPLSAVTLTDCRLYRIPTDEFMKLLKNDLNVSLYFHHKHSQEIFSQIARVEQFGALSARKRLEQLLWKFIRATNLNASQQDVRVHLPLKYWEIAALVGVTPEYLSMMLKRMEKEGVIRRHKGWLIITDLQPPLLLAPLRRLPG